MYTHLLKHRLELNEYYMMGSYGENQSIIRYSMNIYASVPIGKWREGEKKNNIPNESSLFTHANHASVFGLKLEFETIINSGYRQA